jgi:hypothetical protein
VLPENEPSQELGFGFLGEFLGDRRPKNAKQQIPGGLKPARDDNS